ncbi:MAG: hypothetical protein WDM89_08120 [Rhizomicrobium sp.]
MVCVELCGAVNLTRSSSFSSSFHCWRVMQMRWAPKRVPVGEPDILQILSFGSPSEVIGPGGKEVFAADGVVIACVVVELTSFGSAGSAKPGDAPRRTGATTATVKNKLRNETSIGQLHVILEYLCQFFKPLAA